MSIECNGIAKIRIDSTSDIVEILPDALAWENEVVDVRGMGAETRHWAMLDLPCPKSGGLAITWQLWEYPAGAVNHKGVEASDGLTVVQDFDYCLISPSE